MKDLVILGYSGHSYVVIDAATSMGLKTLAYLDKNQATYNPYGLKYFGNDNDSSNNPELSKFLIFPAVGNNQIRKKIIATIEQNNWNQTKIVDASANISPLASIGLNSLISPRVAINSLAKISKGCIINTGAIIEHSCSIADFSHVAPGAVLSGNVQIGRSVFIGAGAVIKQGVIVKDDAIIGAGSVVLNDIREGETWVGNPAKRIR